MAAGKPTGTQKTVPLPPIHVDGQEKIIIDTTALSDVSLGKLGKSSTDTRRRINHFHTLIKEYSKLASKKQTRGNDLSAEDMVSIGERIEDVSREMAQMGGLDWYQKASLLGQCKQRGGDTSRWLVPKMRDLGVDKRPGKTRLLDVGALSCLNYAKERKWIDVTPIDLNSQEPGIYKQDFLDIELDSNAPVPLLSQHDDADSGEESDVETNTAHLFQSPFDVICLSLVVNFIGDPARRGDMLKQAARLLAPEGLLFLVLPLSCVANSRYLDDERLLEIMQFLGFTQLHQNHTAKLAHYLYRLTASIPATASASGDEPQFKKKMLHSAPGRNNFSIVV
ncbi:25S rRNA (adenine2142-N1)-methyltransferase [Kickxella alabastrina]|uniref:25S rRNA (Adenine2142-N1)-methyltransferase n=1 Tax=Kickxella alabastrina TaxID=61397 RepID=A0ACC1IT28_9FUNG|nr:25S rRNA (adenine2142-N1)-methyltransferase [Kickxella alabastrina]